MSVKSLKITQITNPNQWPGLIVFLSVTGLTDARGVAAITPAFWHQCGDNGIIIVIMVIIIVLQLYVTSSSVGGREFDPRPPRCRLVGTEMGDRSSLDGHTTSVCNQPPRPTQPPTLCGTGNEHHPKCGDALWLGVKAGWFIPFVDKRVGGR